MAISHTLSQARKERSLVAEQLFGMYKIHIFHVVDT